MAGQLREDDAQDPEEIVAALARLPVLSGELKDMPEPALRALFESLGLTITYIPGKRAFDIQITLADGSDGTDNGEDRNDPAGWTGGSVQTCSVPPPGAATVLRRRPVQLADRVKIA